MTNKFVTKIGTAVCAKFADYPMRKIIFDSDQEAIDFCNLIQTLDPLKKEDIAYFNEVCESYVDPDIRKLTTEREKLEKYAALLAEAHLIHPDLYSKNNSLYHKATKTLSIPEVVAKEIVRRHVEKESLDSIMNFWKLTALNPNPQAREGLFRFITDLDLTLTNSGLFIAYRNVVNLTEVDSESLEELSQLYIKTVRSKKSPALAKLYSINDIFGFKTFAVIDCEMEDEKFNAEVLRVVKKIHPKYHNNDDGFENPNYDDALFIDEDEDDFEPEFIGEYEYIEQYCTVIFMGNLSEVYSEKVKNSSEIKFTDDRTKTMSIQLGVPVSLPRTQCDSNPDVSCSRGLHLGSKNFMKPTSFGNQALICLVNPRDVVAVPHAYGNAYKMRVCQYLPIAFAEYDKNHALVELNVATMETDFDKYLMQDLENLREILNSVDISEAVDHQIIPAEFDWINAVGLLNNIKKNIEQRVINV